MILPKRPVSYRNSDNNKNKERTVTVKITTEQKLLYAERKLNLPRTVKINSIIYNKVRERDAFLKEKHNAYQILRSSYKRLDFQEYLSQLYHWQTKAATNQLKYASSRLIRKFTKAGLTSLYVEKHNVPCKARKRFYH